MMIEFNKDVCERKLALLGLINRKLSHFVGFKNLKNIQMWLANFQFPQFYGPINFYVNDIPQINVLEPPRKKKLFLRRLPCDFLLIF